MGTLLVATAASVALAGTGVDPALRVLLRTTAADDPRHESEFFRTLVKLGARYGTPAADLTLYDSGESTTGGRAAGFLDSGRAVVVHGRDGARVVAVLGCRAYSVPGIVVQQVVAFDPAGRVTDRVMCSINSRYGGLATEFPAKPEADGAELVVRFVPNRFNAGGWHNWHTVTRDGKGHMFWAKERGDPVDWAKQGLVRAALRGGKFRVLFPTLPEPAGKTP